MIKARIYKSLAYTGNVWWMVDADHFPWTCLIPTSFAAKLELLGGSPLIRIQILLAYGDNPLVFDTRTLLAEVIFPLNYDSWCYSSRRLDAVSFNNKTSLTYRRVMLSSDKFIFNVLILLLLWSRMKSLNFRNFYILITQSQLEYAFVKAYY